MMRMLKISNWTMFSRATRAFGASRSGHAAIMFSILALPLILAIGFVMDLAQANRYRSELQNVADAVALTAVRGLPISELQGQMDGKSLYESLMAGIRAGLITDDVKIVFQTVPELKSFVEVNATAKGIFGNNMSLGPVRYEVNAQAVLGAKETEIAMVIDLSASMTTTKIRALGNSMLAFDKAIMETAPAMARLRLAVVPFAQTVTLPRYAANWLTDPNEVLKASTLPGICFAAGDTTQDVAVAPPVGKAMKLLANYARCMPDQAFALSDSFTQYRAMANGFKNPPSWRATWNGQQNGPYWGTAIYLGASWANRLLSQGWGAYLPAASAPRSSNKASKYALIMTDGEQMALDAYSRAKADAMLLAVCNTMRASGIEVFTVGFEVNAASKALLKNCAGKADNFIAANSDIELKIAFDRIGRTIGEAMPRLVF
jgi:Flp pilus assembly protein TadG